MAKTLCFLFLIAVYCFLAVGSSQRTEKDKRKPDDIAAKVMCEGFVSKKLKAPSTADYADAFDGVSSAKWLNSDNEYHYFEMDSWVDAQNSFGATTRKKFYCKIKNKIGSDNWELMFLDI